MCFIMEKSLYRENKSLKRQLEEYRKRIKIDKECMLVEALNCYMKEKGLIKDFEKFLKTYTGEFMLDSAELQEVWENV